jgi:tungstate transport system permease protein
MHFLWEQLRAAVPLITSGNSYIWQAAWVSIKVATSSTVLALVIGLPVALTIGLGRFRGRRALQLLANATLATPPVVVGVFVLLCLLQQGPFGSLRLAFSLDAVIIAQTILALPYIVALIPAAIQGLPPGLLDQARLLGAGRLQLSLLALREARIGVLAAVIAAVGAGLSEVGAVIIVGANVQGYDETLASSIVSQINDYGNDTYALAIGIVLLGLILIVVGVLTFLQQRPGGLQLRFKGAA